MPRPGASTSADLEALDRLYREGGLRAMASPHVHYDEIRCPRPGCDQVMEWVDFKLEPHGDPEGIYKALVRSWWQGIGFAGRCPRCRGWIRFTTLRKEPLDEAEAARLPRLPDDWHDVAQIA
jgi:hypothetical protein